MWFAFKTYISLALKTSIVFSKFLFCKTFLANSNISVPNEVIRSVNGLLHNWSRLTYQEALFSDQSPHRRREKLFHTLIFSIATFFVSVLGQTYIEIAVFWVDDREEVANLSKWLVLCFQIGIEHTVRPTTPRLTLQECSKAFSTFSFSSFYFLSILLRLSECFLFFW